jgi:hypothetical protein
VPVACRLRNGRFKAATEVADGRTAESQSILAQVSPRIEAFASTPVGFYFGAGVKQQLESEQDEQDNAIARSDFQDGNPRG